MRCATASSVAPPNIMVPRHKRDTFRPLSPKPQYSTVPSLTPTVLRILPQTTLGGERATRLNGKMEDRAAIRSPDRPSLGSLFLSFVSIGMMSFGGGLAAWTRREVVQKRGWMDDTQFLSGYALSQLLPGATNVNLAVFIGAQMRGNFGALACLAGLTALPLVIVLGAGLLYFRNQ